MPMEWKNNSGTIVPIVEWEWKDSAGAIKKIKTFDWKDNAGVEKRVYTAVLDIYKDGAISGDVTSSYTRYGYVSYSAETNETTSLKWESHDGTDHSHGGRSFAVSDWTAFTRLELDLELWTDGSGGMGYAGSTWKRCYVSANDFTDPPSNYMTPLSVSGRIYTFDVTSWTGSKTFHVGSWALASSAGGKAYVRCGSIRAY